MFRKFQNPLVRLSSTLSDLLSIGFSRVDVFVSCTLSLTCFTRCMSPKKSRIWEECGKCFIYVCWNYNSFSWNHKCLYKSWRKTIKQLLKYLTLITLVWTNGLMDKIGTNNDRPFLEPNRTHHWRLHDWRWEWHGQTIGSWSTGPHLCMSLLCLKTWSLVSVNEYIPLNVFWLYCNG